MDHDRNGHTRQSCSGDLHLARRDNSDHLRAGSHTPRETAIRGKAMKREYDFSHAKRGPVVSVPKGKTRITIRLDDDVLDWFRQQVDRAGGGNYQSLINDALRQHIRRRHEPLEATLRRVIREELSTRTDANGYLIRKKGA